MKNKNSEEIKEESKTESKDESQKSGKSKKVLINTLILFLIFVVGIVMYARLIGVKGLVVREYRIENAKIPTNFSGVKIIHFSDLLYKSTVDINDVKKLVDKMNELKPDLVFFTGGLVSEGVKLSEEERNDLVATLGLIDVTIGKYAVKGNEDGDEADVILTETGFTILNNEGLFIYNKGLTPIYLGGFASSIKDTTNVETTFQIVDTDVNKDAYFKMLLMHEGDSANSLFNSRSDIDLVMAGNSLNGSVIVPFYGGIYLPNGSEKYYDKYYEVGETKMFVSGGIGTQTLNYRFNNRPSFNFYRLAKID